MKQKIVLFDTTLRDGSQMMGVHFSMEDKIRIARELDEFGIDYIEGGWPGSNPKDAAFFREMSKYALSRAKLTAFSSTRLKDHTPDRDPIVQEVLRAEVPVAAIFGKCWDVHAEKGLGVSLQENLDMISSTVAYLKDRMDEVVFDGEHFFDGFKANPEYAMACLKAAEEAGADWIVPCDTNGGTLPTVCAEAMAFVAARIKAPLGIHAHNDSGVGVANSIIGVEKGAEMVQGTINGLGERCGNADLCSIIPNLVLKGGYDTRVTKNLHKLRHISLLVSELSNMALPVGTPYVGDNAFTHKGGIHVSAVRKFSSAYEHIEPETVGNDRRISVSDQSGRSNIFEKAKELGISLEGKEEYAGRIVKRIKELENEGYHFEGAEASFELLTCSLMGTLKNYFDLHGFRVIVSKTEDGKSFSEATIKAEVPEETSSRAGHESHIEHTTAEGSGPVEALDKGLRKILEKFYPVLKKSHLVDYKVRILNEAAGTSAITRVLITTADENRRWGTIGVSDNIIDASWQALTDGLIYKLKKDEEEGIDVTKNQDI